MCEISIIVPVYKVEKYLKKCVDSILNQTFSDIEVILVDDGSPDRSGIICDEYAKNDTRVKVIHKENGGLSSARNAGIEVAQGRFIGFVDSDDYIATDMYQLLYEDITREEADMAICGIVDIYSGDMKRTKPVIQEVLSKKEAIQAILEAKIVSVHAVNKLYDSRLFSQIRYPEGIITEDAAVILDILNLTNRVVIDTQPSYFYYHRDESISSKAFSSRDMDTIKVWSENETWLNVNYPDLSELAHTRVCWAYFIVLDKIMLTKNYTRVEYLPQIVSYLRRNFKFIIENKVFLKQRKIAMIFLMMNVRFYKILSLTHEKFILKKNK
ncbi:glycosyltransferase family 2 protein [Enterococcus sp. AD013-P3]|uniref:glycosyltransferase family 2 protein n=1 Tax=Enterococcus sp. AD013-P3 TaxID=3411036 RepID=UPI003B956EBF